MGDDAAGRDVSPPIGRPIANTRAYVLDRHLNLAPVGAPGELHVGGVGLARGYLRRPGLTAERFIPDPFSAEPGARLYKTGDLVSYLPDGRLDFVGRIDNQVKVRGYRIELGEIEAALCEHAAVREAVVLAREDLPGVKQLVAYFVRSPESAEAEASAPTVEELRRSLKERLPEHMVPSVFVPLESLPLTANGKTDRRALPAPRQGASAPAASYVAPRNPTEETLAAVWAEVLGVERVGVDDNFFELGGDSILSIRIIARAGQRGVEISPNQLFLHPTVGELAEQCAPPAGRDPRAESSPEKLPPRQTPPPGARTLADFPDADLSQKELDLLLTRLAGTTRAD
jgi:aryl carrier-like protein